MIADEVLTGIGDLGGESVLRRPLEPGQYLSIRYAERLAGAGIEPSVGSIGDSYDNALAESVIGLFKTAIIRRRGPWRSIDDVEIATLEWVSWFNTRRILEPISGMLPVEFEARYYRARQTTAMEAGVNQNGPRESRGDPSSPMFVGRGYVL